MLNNAVLKRLFDIQNAVKVTALASASGLSKNAVSNILHDRTTDPGIYTISKIADALECSIEELISDDGIGTHTELKTHLARSCIITTVDLLREAESKIDFEEFLFVLKEIYVHSLNQQAKEADLKFASTYVHDFLKNKDVKR